MESHIEKLTLQVSALTSQVQLLTAQVQTLTGLFTQQLTQQPANAKPAVELLNHFDHIKVVDKCLEKGKYQELLRYGKFYLDEFGHHLEDSLENLKVAEHVISNVADLEAVIYDGVTLAEIACTKGWTDVVKLLIKYGANFNKCNGDTAFLMAVEKGRIDIVKLLIGNAVLSYEYDDTKYSALSKAIDTRKDELIDIVSDAVKRQGGSLLPTRFNSWLSISDIKQYLRIGVSATDILCHDGFTVNVSNAILKLLKTSGADLNAVNHKGRTFLHRLISHGRGALGYIDVLYELGARFTVFEGELDFFTWAQAYDQGAPDVILPYLLKDGVGDISALLTHIFEAGIRFPMLEYLNAERLDQYREVILQLAKTTFEDKEWSNIGPFMKVCQNLKFQVLVGVTGTYDVYDSLTMVLATNAGPVDVWVKSGPTTV